MPLTPAESETYIEYNGFKFPQYLKMSTKATPVPGFGNRANRYIEITVTLETMLSYDVFSSAHEFGPDNVEALNSSNNAVVALTSGDKLDTVTIPLFRKLLEKGKRLIIRGLGLGNIDLDPAVTGISSRLDLNNGPTPQIVDLTNFTNARAYRLVWSVTFTINPCSDRTISATKPTVDGFNFTIHYGVTPDGMITRTVTGRITIPNWVKGGETAINTDPLREKIEKSFPIPYRFQRQQYHHISEDRTQLSFTLTDSEIPSNNAYPNLVTSINAQQTASLSKLHALNFKDVSVGVQITVSGSLMLAPGVPKDFAWLIIIDILQQKVSSNAIPNSGEGGLPRTTIIACGFSITDGLFDRSVSFSFNYTIPLSLKNFWIETGMFKPLNYKWEDWAEYKNTVQKSLGFNGEETFAPSKQKDFVITVCDSDNETPTKEPEPIETSDTSDTYKTTDANLAFFNTKLKTEVSQANSYISYINKVEQHSNYNVAVVGVIGEGDAAQFPPAGTGSGSDSNEAAFQIKPIRKGQSLSIENGMHENPINNTVQQRGTGKHYVTLQGSGRRVRFPVGIPQLDSLGEDLPIPVLLSERLEASHLAGYTADGVAIYEASWHRVYCLPGIVKRDIGILNLAAIDNTPTDPSFRLA